MQYEMETIVRRLQVDRQFKLGLHDLKNCCIRKESSAATTNQKRKIYSVEMQRHSKQRFEKLYTASFLPQVVIFFFVS